MNRDNSIKTLNYSPLLLSIMLGLGVTSEALADGIMAPQQSQQMGWYLGAAVSALWSSLPDNMYVNNGGPFPYNNDLYSLDRGTDTALAVQVGYTWPAHNQWLSDYSLGLQYEHYWLGSFDGTITQYSLPQFLNYSYLWGMQADTVSLYSKLHVFQYGAIRPFIKGGIGLAINRSGSFYETAFAGVTPRISPGFGRHTENSFAYNAGAGVDYDISKKLSISLAYNYQSLGAFRSGNGMNTWSGDYLNLKNYQANMLVVGMTYYLDS